MKRLGMKGNSASHGASLSHRSLGSTGQGGDPGKVFKGKKMHGRMGGKQRTVKNVWVYKIEPARNLIWVKGQSQERSKAKTSNLYEILYKNNHHLIPPSKGYQSIRPHQQIQSLDFTGVQASRIEITLNQTLWMHLEAIRVTKAKTEQDLASQARTPAQPKPSGHARRPASGRRACPVWTAPIPQPKVQRSPDLRPDAVPIASRCHAPRVRTPCLPKPNFQRA